VHFSHNDVLIIIMLIGNCRVSKILVDGGKSVNILYGGALNRMEDNPEITRAMIAPQTKSHQYEFNKNETHSPGTISLPARVSIGRFSSAFTNFCKTKPNRLDLENSVRFFDFG